MAPAAVDYLSQVSACRENMVTETGAAMWRLFFGMVLYYLLDLRALLAGLHDSFMTLACLSILMVDAGEIVLPN